MVRFSTIFCVAAGLVVFVLSGCIGIEVQLGAGDTGGGDAGVWITHDSRARIDSDADGGSNFQKPRTRRKRARTYKTSEDVSASGYQRLVEVSLWTRNYMAEPDSHRTVFLYHGEHFALDGAISVLGPEAPPVTRYRVRVLVDFRAVPFEIRPVDKPGGWISRKRFVSLNYTERNEIRVAKGEPYNFTLVVPPSSLGSRGAHDVRVLFVRVGEPDAGRSGGGRTKLSNTGYHLKYGGHAPVRQPQKFPGVKRVQPDGRLRWNVATEETLLYPRAKRRALTNGKVEDEDLGGVFSNTDGRFRMEAMVGGSTIIGNRAGTNYYMIFRDGDPVAGLRGTGRTRAIPDRLTYGSGETDPAWASRLRFELTLNDQERHAIRLVSFPAPYRDFRSFDISPTGRDSNVIFVRQRP